MYNEKLKEKERNSIECNRIEAKLRYMGYNNNNG